MIDHHHSLEVDGLFLAGTCGEGPWMTVRQTKDLVRSAIEANRGRMKIGVQVTENSPDRTLEKIDVLGLEDCDYLVIAQPSMFMNGTPSRVISYYMDILNRVSKPVCFYNRGSRPDFPLEPSVLSEIYAHPAVQLIKDSASNAEHRAVALQARKERPELKILNGNEFLCQLYLEEGYDGLMTGGAIVSGGLLRQMIKAFQQGNKTEADRIDDYTQRLLKAIYGGEQFPCWLTGLKYCLVRMGIFSSQASFLGYPLSEECRKDIDRLVTEKAWRTVPDTQTVA